MSERSVLVRHTGRETVATAAASGDEFRALREALLSDEFYVTRDNGESELRLRRNIRPMRGDWPIAVSMRRSGAHIEIRYCLFVPWSWFIPFCLMVLFILPFVSFQGAVFAFPVALFVIGFAGYKRRFDFRPRAVWQGPPRAKWNGKMNDLFSRVFHATVQESA